MGLQTGGLHKRGCHCKKSHCKKKYCECFQARRLILCPLISSCHTCSLPEPGLSNIAEIMKVYMCPFHFAGWCQLRCALQMRGMSQYP